MAILINKFLKKKIFLNNKKQPLYSYEYKTLDFIESEIILFYFLKKNTHTHTQHRIYIYILYIHHFQKLMFTTIVTRLDH